MNNIPKEHTIAKKYLGVYIYRRTVYEPNLRELKDGTIKEQSPLKTHWFLFANGALHNSIDGVIESIDHCLNQSRKAAIPDESMVETLNDWTVF